MGKRGEEAAPLSSHYRRISLAYFPLFPSSPSLSCDPPGVRRFSFPRVTHVSPLFSAQVITLSLEQRHPSFSAHYHRSSLLTRAHDTLFLDPFSLPSPPLPSPFLSLKPSPHYSDVFANLPTLLSSSLHI